MGSTRLGQLANVRVGDDAPIAGEHLWSHAAGLGAPLRQRWSGGCCCSRFAGWCAATGVQPETVDRLVDFLNAGLMPVVPRQGSLGASGDLAPLSHVLAVAGRRRADAARCGRRLGHRPAAEVLAEQGWSPISLGPKEGLALINGTQMMSALLAHSCQLETLWAQAHGIASLSLAAFEGLDAPFHPMVHALRQHEGQQASAAEMRTSLDGAAFLRETHEWVQDPYSFGAFRRYTERSDGGGSRAHHVGRRSHRGDRQPDPVAGDRRSDQRGQLPRRAPAVVLTTSRWRPVSWAPWRASGVQVVERNAGFAPFLATDPGLDSGLMIVQYTAASIVARNKMRAMPASVDTIDSSNGQEDHVSMGANAGLQLLAVIDGTRELLACELLTASQALHFRSEPGLSPRQSDFLSVFRHAVPPQEGDVEQSARMRSAVAFLEAEG